MTESKNIGWNLKAPSKTCADVHCPFHGELRLHGRMFVGTISKRSSHRTVNVEWPRIFFLPKFERYAKRRSKVKAHNPDCIEANVGDKVLIAETRPISKTKTFVVVRIEQ